MLIDPNDYETLAVLAQRDRIDIVCDQFEAEWIKGVQPSIHDYLDFHGCSPEDRKELINELLLIDIEYRRSEGMPISKADYLELFPDLAESIEKVAFEHGLADDGLIGKLSSPLDSLARGTRLAHFVLNELIGSGASGDVWKARDIRLQRSVAVKIPRNRQLSEDEIRRFLREGRASAQLRHTNIVSVYDVVRVSDVAFIVSEFIDGCDLRQKLQSDRFGFNATVEICAKLADALHHAHEHGVVHRDFKPANVLLDCENKPHVTDFGLAKWSADTSEMTIGGQLLGTPAYMSPEQARGESAKVDHRTDVYALGIMLYEMLAGTVPFVGDQSTLLYSAINEEPKALRSINKQIPLDLETICLKAIEKAPERRYQSAQEIALDLRRFLRGEPILARRTDALEKTWRWVKRRPAMSAAILFAIVAFGSILTAMVLSEENRALLGLQTVELTTDPPGAKVVFVSLDSTTGAPQRDRVVRPRKTSPVREDLLPGDYLVVAVLEDGRFHEVLRHVPEHVTGLPGAYNHLFWEQGSNGSVRLPSIEIPGKSVTDKMALLDTGQASSMAGMKNSSIIQSEKISPFFMDTTEVTCEDYRRNHLGCAWPSKLQHLESSPNRGMSIRYDAAVAYAEAQGKRLPTEFEFEYASMLVGLDEPQWNKQLSSLSTPDATGNVGTLQFDVIPTSPPIYGLRSHLAEWTISMPLSPHEDTTGQLAPLSQFSSMNQYRIVCGGDRSVADGELTLRYECRRPDAKCVLNRATKNPGVGFRCVRSALPRFVDE